MSAHVFIVSFRSLGGISLCLHRSSLYHSDHWVAYHCVCTGLRCIIQIIGWHITVSAQVFIVSFRSLGGKSLCLHRSSLCHSDHWVAYHRACTGLHCIIQIIGWHITVSAQVFIVSFRSLGGISLCLHRSSLYHSDHWVAYHRACTGLHCIIQIAFLSAVAHCCYSLFVKVQRSLPNIWIGVNIV